MLIRNVAALLGADLTYEPQANIRIKDGRFGHIGRQARQDGGDMLDCEGLLAVPGFVNCHTHLGDSIAKDAYLGGTADKKIHPVFGIKTRILQSTSPEHLAGFMRNSCISMMRKGITTFADFREGRASGVRLLQEAMAGLPIRGIILGRTGLYHTRSQIRQNAQAPADITEELAGLLELCDGIGISGANECSSAVLGQYSATPKLRAIHAAETEQSVQASKKITGRSEVSRALEMRPHFLVHMTHATKRELRMAARRSVGIVACPRANASLAEGVPDVVSMAESGCTVGLGTDNVMINPPDMLREMDYTWKVAMGTRKKPVHPREILKMATVNGGRILHMDVGQIRSGMLADCVLFDKHALDLEPMHDPHAAIVHRTDSKAIRAVIIGGKIVHGRI